MSVFRRSSRRHPIYCITGASLYGPQMSSQKKKKRREKERGGGSLKISLEQCSGKSGKLSASTGTYGAMVRYQYYRCKGRFGTAHAYCPLVTPRCRRPERSIAKCGRNRSLTITRMECGKNSKGEHNRRAPTISVVIVYELTSTLKYWHGQTRV